MRQTRPRQLCGILLTFAVLTAEFLAEALYLYPKSAEGKLLSVRHASSYLPAIFVQTLIPFLFPAGLLAMLAVFLKKDFASELYFRFGGKWQRILCAMICTGTAGLTAFCLAVKEDKITVLFSLLYYFVFTAFAEEFVCRDVCTWFLRESAWPVRYLLPNIGFAVLYIFSYADWGRLTVPYLLHFAVSDLLGLTVSGCMFQLLKEKSGTIWLPVLIHGLMDYSVVLKY